MTQPAQITVYDPNGALVQIAPADLPNAQAQGYVIADQAPAEPGVYEKSVARGFSPTVSTGLAAISPLLSYEQGTVAGATAGIGSALQRKLAGVLGPIAAKAVGGPELTTKEAEDFYKDIAQGGAHPFIHGTGEVAGMVGAGVAAGPLRAAGGGVGALGRGLGLIGEAGEGAAAGARALTGGLAARGALGRAAATGAEMAARGATELGIYEGVKEISEEMLGDPPLNAEKIYAAAADGAFGGAVFGGVLGAGGSLVKSGVKGLGSIAHDVASKNADSLQGFANEQRWRALDPLKKFSEEANARVPGGTAAVGETLGRYKVVGAGVDDALKTGEETIGQRLNAAVDEVGAKLGAITDASQGKVTYGAIDDAIESVIAPIRKKAGQEAIVNSLEAYKASLASKMLPEVAPGASAGTEAALRATEIPLQDALFQRKALDELVYKESKALDPQLRVQLLRDFRAKFEDTIVNAFDDAARAAGNDGAKAELLGLKRDYQALSLAKEAAEASTSRMATNRNLSLSDYISGGIASTMGAGIGQAIGGDYGEAIGGVLGGVAGARFNKFGRARGNAVAAAVADRIAAFGGRGRTVIDLAADRAAPMAERALVSAEVAPKATEALEAAPAAAVAEAAPKVVETAPTFDFNRMRAINGEGTKVEYLTDKLRTKRALRQLFGDEIPTPEAFSGGIWKLPEGFSTKVRRFEGYTGVDKYQNITGTNMARLTIAGDILKDGEKAANYIQIFERRPDGALVAYLDRIDVAPKFRGMGIGNAMSQDAIPAYKQLGVDRIELDAGLSHGKYTWAKKGYEWKDPEDQAKLQSEFQKFLIGKGVEPEQAAQLAEHASISPRALADAKLGAEEAGKDFLMQPGQHNEWAGKMSVDAAHAEMLQKTAEFARAQEAIKKVDSAVDSAAKGLVEPSGSAPYRTPAKAKPLRDRYDEARAQVDKATENMQSVVRRAQIPPNSMPKTSEALSAGVLRAANFLAQSAPPPIVQQSTLGRANPTRTSNAAMQDFVNMYDAANNPLATMRKFARGRITHAEVEALKVVSPELFKQLQMQSMKLVIDRQAKGDPLPFQARQRMHVLLGILTDPSQDPKLTKLLQSNLNDPTQQQEPMGAAPPAPSRPVNMPDMSRKLDRLEEG